MEMNESVPKMKMSASSHHESHAIGARRRHTLSDDAMKYFDYMSENNLNLVTFSSGDFGLDVLDRDVPSKINDGTACTSSECLLKNKHPCLESLSKEFSELLHHRDHENHDVEFECEGESIKANGAIVSARSHVIASMITKGQQKIIKISDMKLEIFKKFLAFLYSETLEELSFAAACDLYVAGRKYAVYSLSTRCSDFLIKNLVVHNGFTLVVLADSHGDDTFRDATVRVILENRCIHVGKRMALCPHQCLICAIKRYLKTTMRTIQQTENLTPHPAQEINLALDKLKHMTQETHEKYQPIYQNLRAYRKQDIEYRERYFELRRPLRPNPELLAKLEQEKELFRQAIRQKILPLRRKFIEHLQRVFIALSEFQNQVLDTELIRWKQSQLNAGNGVPFDDNMDQRQEWCEDLAEIIYENRVQTRLVESVWDTLLLPNEMRAEERLLISQFLSLLSSFVTRLVN